MVGKKKRKEEKGKKETKKEITKDMTFGEVMYEHQELGPVFLEHGMACIGCPMAMSETIEQGAKAHGIDPEKLIADLNKKLKKKKEN